MGDLFYLIAGIAVIGVLLLVGLLARTRSGRPAPPAGTTDVIATPVETTPEELDTTPAETPVEAPAAPAPRRGGPARRPAQQNGRDGHPSRPCLVRYIRPPSVGSECSSPTLTAAGDVSELPVPYTGKVTSRTDPVQPTGGLVTKEQPGITGPTIRTWPNGRPPPAERAGFGRPRPGGPPAEAPAGMRA